MGVSDQDATSYLAISDALDCRIVASNSFGTSGRVGAFLQNVEGGCTNRKST